MQQRELTTVAHGGALEQAAGVQGIAVRRRKVVGQRGVIRRCWPTCELGYEVDARA